MAIEKTVKINIDTSQAVAGVDKLNTSIKQTEEETEKVKKSSSGLGSTLDKVTGGAVSKFKGMTSSLGGVAGGFKGIGVAIAASGLGLLLITIGAIKTAFTASEEGQNKFAKIMGVIGSVTGNLIDVISDVGEVIIGVFSGDSEAIKSATDFGKKIFDVVGLPIKNIIDIVKTAGKVLGSLFSGDVEGAIDNLNEGINDVKGNFIDAGEAISGAAQALKDFGEEAMREAAIAADIADQRAKADKIERGLITERAEADRRISELRGIASRQDLFGLEERKQALIEASVINEEITNKEIVAAKLRSEAIIAENKLSKSTKEDLDKEAQARAKLIQLETKRLNLQKRLGTEISSINNQAASQSAARAKARETQIAKEVKAEEKRLDDIQKLQSKFALENEDLSDKTHEEKLETLRNRAQEELDLLIGTETEKREAQISLNALFDAKELELKEQRKAEDEEKAATERDEEFEKALEAAENEALAFDERRILLDERRQAILEDETLTEEERTNLIDENTQARIKLGEEESKAKVKATNAIKNTLNTASELLGKSTAAGKVAAIAATTIDTIQSGVSAFKGMVSSIPGPVGIAAGAVAAAGALASGFASVKKILAVKTPGGAGGGAPSSPTAPQAPAFNLVGSTGVNQIQESLEDETAPMQAFVVGADVTSQQELDRNQESSASIG